MKKFLLLLSVLLTGVSGAWADVLPSATVGTYAFQAQALTTGASDYNISKNGDNDVIISAKNGGYLGAYTSTNKDYLTCTLVVKINVPSTPTTGILCQMRKAADDTDAAQGLYLTSDRKLKTSWQEGTGRQADANAPQLAAGEHTIIYTAGTGETGAKVYIDGTTTTFSDTGLKGGNAYYKVIYIPAAYAPYITEVHFFSSVQDATNITSIATECSNHLHASQQSGESVTVPSGKTLVIDADNNLSKYSFDGAVNIAVASGKTLTLDQDGSSISSLTGSGTALQSTDITTTVAGNLSDLTLKATAGTLKYTGKADAEPTLDGTTLYGVTLAGSYRIKAIGDITIENLAGNDQSTAANTYAFYTNTNVSVTLKGNCDFTKKSDGTDATAQYIGVNSGGTLTIADNANVKVKNLYNSTTVANNANITIGSGATLESTGSCYSPNVTNNGTLTMGSSLNTNGLTLNEGSTINISGSNLSGTTTVSGDATLNATADLTLSQAITVAASKTLTIDGGSNTVNLNVLPTFGASSKINFKNATINYPSDIRNLANYTFTSSTAKFIETTDEYKAGGFTITNIPSGVTIKVKKYGATDYETETPTDGTVTISHAVGVSGSAAWLDYTFNESTKAINLHSPADQVITNAGNAGSGNNLTIDTGYKTDNSYNSDGTLKVMSTPWRNITWPSNYTVAVAGNVPDVENGCLVGFGSIYSNGNYIALIRGANQNEIKLVKGAGNSTAYQVITTMTASNATALSHLVVFTKNGNTFTVYLDGVQKAQVDYSATLGGGLQIGSLHGGVGSTGIVKVTDISDETLKAKVFAKTIRVYDYVISAAQMSQLTTEFPYVSFGGTYSRTISENSNLSATDAWLNRGTQKNADVPINAEVEEVTYYPDVEITTTAASTLTVNADMDAENITFDGAGKLTIESDGSHNINIYGSVTADGPVSVNYDQIDLTAVPVTIGESGSIEFDFSDHDFSDVFDATEYPVTGNTSDYDTKVTGVYPSDTEDHTYTLAYNNTSHRYILTVEPTLALKQQQAIDIVAPYEDYIGTGVGKYTAYLGETAYTDYADFEAAVTSWDEVGDYVASSVSFNMPTNGFYRFKAAARSASDDTYNWYMGGNADGIYSASTNDAQASDANTIFYLEKDGSGYHPINYVTGLYSNGTANNAIGTKSNFTLTQAIKENNSDQLLGEYKLVNTGTSKTIVMWSNATLNAIDGNNDWSGWTIEPVESLPVTFKGEYASFYSPVDLTIPEGVKAYTGGITHDNWITLNEIEGTTLPHETGVILKYEGYDSGATDADNTKNFTILDTETEGSSTLTGTIATSTVDANSKLVLGKNSGDWGIFKYTGTVLNGFKAYMDMPGGSIKGFTFSFDDVDEVVSILNGEKGEGEVYDLSGRRINKPARGFYITKGQKAFVK